MADVKKLVDPKSFGPGAWLIIHILAYNAKRDEAKRDFEAAMHKICSGLKCKNCKVHCGEYLKNHPIRDYWHVKNKNGVDIGMFKWSWTFHNAVNQRLGKEIMDFDTAYHLYSEDSDMVCTKDCGGESHSPRLPRHGDSHAHQSHHAHQSNHAHQSRHRDYYSPLSGNGLIKFVSTETALRPNNRNRRRRK